MRAKFLFGLTMVAAVIAVVFADGTIVAQTFNPEAQANYLVQLDAATGDVNFHSANCFPLVYFSVLVRFFSMFLQQTISVLSGQLQIQ